MVLKRFGIRHARAVTLAARAARRPRLIAAVRFPPWNVSFHGPAGLVVATDASIDIERLYTTIGARVVPNDSKFDFSNSGLLDAGTTIESWPQRLQELGGPKVKDQVFWKEVFGLSKARFGVAGLHETLKVFLECDFGLSETVSLYNLRNFPRDFILPDYYRYILPKEDTEDTHGVAIASELTYLRSVCEYVRVEESRFNRRPPEKRHVYQQILSRVLAIAPERTEEFHELLTPLVPSQSDIIALILSSGTSTPKEEALQSLCDKFPRLENAYDAIIEPLCQSNRISGALSWHRWLTKHNHWPQNAAVMEPLIEHLYRLNRTDEARSLEQIGKDHTRSELGQIAASIESRFPQGRIQRSEWNDEKSARIYATRFLSLTAVLSTLKLFSVNELGPSSIREVLLRCSDAGKVDLAILQNHLELLGQAGISSNASVYGRLAHKLLGEDGSASLHQLATIDIHPEEFNDTTKLNAILAHLDAKADANKWDLIVSALLVDTTAEQRQLETMNLLLRRSVSRTDDVAILQILDNMKAARIPATEATLQVMYQKFMKQQHQESIQPISQVERFSKLLSWLMENGLFVPPAYWDDILRTLLLCGALDMHEGLCIRIASWYQEPRYQRKYEAQKVLHPSTLSTQRAFLFRPQCVNEIIMYYMYHANTSQRPAASIPGSQPAKVRAGILASHPVLRGLRLLLRLRDLGINIDIETIQHILRTRLWLVCRRNGCELASGVVVKRLNKVQERDYHLAAEILIGVRDPVLQNMRYQGEREKTPLVPHVADGPFDDRPSKWTASIPEASEAAN